MYAMDPGAVRTAGGSLGRLGGPVRAAAGALESLPVPRAVDGPGVGPEVADLLAVWADAVAALATELGLLDERCAASARGVRSEDDRARSDFAGRRAASGRGAG